MKMKYMYLKSTYIEFEFALSSLPLSFVNVRVQQVKALPPEPAHFGRDVRVVVGDEFMHERLDLE